MKKGHLLKAIPGFPSVIAAKLATYSITTAQEFLAHVELGEPELRSALGADAGAFERAISVARETVGSEYDESLRQIRDAPNYPLGALSPTTDEFNEFLREQEAGEDL